MPGGWEKPNQAAALGASESVAAVGASESAAALGASESAAALGASQSAAALGARASPATGPASAEALHTFTFDSGASRCFFCYCTTLTPLAAPVPVSLADPTEGPVVARASTVLPCPAVSSGSLSGLHLPTFLSNLVSNTVIQDVCVDTFIHGGQRVAICTLSSGTTASVTPPYRVSVVCTPVSLSLAFPGPCPPSPTRLPRHAFPDSRGGSVPLLSPPSFLRPLLLYRLSTWTLGAQPPSEGTGQERYFLLVVDDYTCYTTVFPLRRKADVSVVLIPRIRATRRQLRERFRQDFPVLHLHSDRGETLPTLRWTGKVGDASVFWVWGVLSLACDAKASKLSSRTLRCVFLGFPTNAPPWQFYHPRSHPPPPPQGPAPSCISQVDPPPFVQPLEVSSESSGPAEGGDPTADDTVATRCSPHLENPPSFPPRLSSPPPQPAAVDFGAETAGAEPRGAEIEGEGSGGAATGVAGSGGAATRGAGSWGASTGGADSGGPVSPSGAGAVGGLAGGPGAGQPPQPDLHETLSPQAIRAWIVRRGSPGGGGYGPAGAGAASPGGTAGARGTGGAGGAVRAGGTRGVAGAGGAGATIPRGATGAGGAGPTCPGGTTGAGGAATARGAGAGGTGGAGAAVPGGARTGDARAAGAGGDVRAGGATRATGSGGTGGTAGARGAGATGAGGTIGAGGAGGATGAASTGGAGGARTRGTGAARAGGAAGAGASGAASAGGAGGAAGAASARGAGAAGAGGAGAAGTALHKPFFYPQAQSSMPPPDSVLRQVLSLPSFTGLPLLLLCPPTEQSQPQLLPCSPLPALAPRSEVTESVTERREPETHASTPVCACRVARPCPPADLGTHRMALCPSSVPQHVVLPEPPTSSLPHVPDPESDHAHAASPTVTRLLATVITDPDLESTVAFSLATELVDFAARSHLDYVASLVIESQSICPPSVGGELALGKMASWKSTGTYVNEVPPPGASIVDGMWIFRVKRPPGSPPALKARYDARGFSQPQGVDFFQTFSPTPNMTTL
ncbi:unnamed protein product [Closterium sp. NIES-54]